MHAHSQKRLPAATDGGSTFVEALLALSLVAVICAGSASPARSAASVFARARRLARLDSSLARANLLLRRGVGRVEFPPRAARLPVATLSDGLRIGYLDGNPHRFLDLRYRDGRLVVSDGVTVDSVEGFSSVSFHFASEGDGAQEGEGVPVVCARLQGAGGESVRICANVGRWPLLPAPSEQPGSR